jgi:hypothetical protein
VSPASFSELAEQIGCAYLAVGAVVGDDQRLGRTGEQVDADAAEQLPFRFGDIGVARADDHVDGGNALSAERHGSHRLHAAEHEDLVGAAEMHRRHDRRMRTALEWRRAGDDVPDAGDPRGNDRHVGGGDHRIAAARYVAADRVHRDVAVSKHDARQRFHLELAQRLLLLLREIAHLRLREPDIVEIALAHLRDRALDLCRCELERGRRPIVKFLRQLTHRGVLARLDVGEDLFDRLAHLCIGRLDGACVHSALEVAGHHVPPSLPEPTL